MAVVSIGNDVFAPGPYFIYIPGRGLIPPPLPPDAALLVNDHGINRSGVIVAAVAPGQTGDLRAVALPPPYLEFIDLNSVFGWKSGYASAINDNGDIVGYESLDSGGPADINNRGQILGFRSNGSAFISTPGQGEVTLPDRSPSRIINNLGHIILNRDSAFISAYIYTGQANIPLPEGCSWFYLNDLDEVTGFCLTGGGDGVPVLYSAKNGPIYLNDVVVADPGWKLHSLGPINNRGQITAFGTLPDGHYVFRILTPVSQTSASDIGTAPMADAPENRPPDAKTRRGTPPCLIRSLNGASLGCAASSGPTQ